MIQSVHDSSRSPVKLQGSRVLVTGGSSGIGRALVMHLCELGCRVMTFARHEDKLQEMAADVNPSSGQLHWLVADQSRPGDIARVFEEADRHLGGLDILICNAAVSNSSVADEDDAAIVEAVSTNVTGYLLCAKHALSRLLPQQQGDLVFVGSMSAQVRGSDSDIYVTTKCAIRGFCESLRKSVSEQGIRIMLMEPGLTGSDMVKGDAAEHRQRQEKNEMLEAEDIAHCIVHTLQQPRRVCIVSTQVRPLMQSI